MQAFVVQLFDYITSLQKAKLHLNLFISFGNNFNNTVFLKMFFKDFLKD